MRSGEYKLWCGTCTLNGQPPLRPREKELVIRQIVPLRLKPISVGLWALGFTLAKRLVGGLVHYPTRNRRF